MADNTAPDDTASIIPLDQVEPRMIEQLLDRAFNPERVKRTAYKLREGTDWLPALSFAAMDSNDMLVGTIQAWPLALTDETGRRHPMLMIGPVAVLPDEQSQGYGRALMLALQEAISPDAPLPQVLIGDAAYYGRYGFDAAHTSGWKLPGPFETERLLARSDNPAILPKQGMLGPWL